MTWLWVVLAAAELVLVLRAGLDILDPPAGRRGGEGAPRWRGSSLGLLDEIYNPGMEYTIEEQSSQRARGTDDASGDGDPGGGPAHHR